MKLYELLHAAVEKGDYKELETLLKNKKGK